MTTRRDIFRALADPSRRAILLMLAAQSLTAGAIAKNFDSSRPTISKHIKVLVECELLNPTVIGREIHYDINPKELDKMEDWLKKFKGIWKSRFENLDEVLTNLKTDKNEK